MAGELIYAFRVMRLPLLDAGGATIGRLDDIVVIPGRPGVAPRVLGFVATSQRRRIFVNAARLVGAGGGKPTYLMVCGPRSPDGLAEPARGRSLWARLQADTAPNWLEPVGEKGAFAVWRVKL